MAISRKVSVPGNAHVKLAFDPSEVIPNTIAREMGFILAEDRGSPLYRAYDDASRAIVDQVARAGFAIDPQTLEVTYEKSAWDGRFGAYLAVPGDNRPGFTIGVDHRRRYPVLAPRRYLAGKDAAQDALAARMSGAVEFRGNFYICVAGREVYRLDNWSGGVGTAYFTQVFQHSDGSAVLRDLVVAGDILYAAAGETAPYAYSTDGSSWVESNRGAPDDKAEQWLVLQAATATGAAIHKIRVPNLHYVLTDAGVDATNGGTAWASADAIGDAADVSTLTGLELLAQSESTVIAKEEGIFNIDSSGNARPIYPELNKNRDSGNGFHAFVWNNVLFYPTFHGELKALRDGKVYGVHPSRQQERRLEVTPERDGIFEGRIRAMAGTQDYLYVEIRRAEDGLHRIVVLEYDGELGFTWRTLLDLNTATSDELFITSWATSGPVLWATTDTEFGQAVAYWVLSAGPDPTADSRVRYGDIGMIFDPWIDFGAKATNKRWASIEVEVAATDDSSTEIIVAIVAEDGTRTQRSITPTTIPSLTTMRLPKGFFSRRARVEITERTTSATETPFPVSYRVHAFLVPEPVRIFDWTAAVPGAGVQGGLATQRVARAFLEEARRAQYPMLFTDPFGKEWPVLFFPPPPAEATTGHDAGRWDEVWRVTLIEEVTREFELMNPAPPDGTPPENGGGGGGHLPPGEVWPGTGTGPQHVWKSGITSAGAPWIAQTFNFMANDADVTWESIGVTDLPTSAVTECVLVIDPWYVPTTEYGTKAWLIVKKSTTLDEIYYSDEELGPATTWSMVLDLAIANTATSEAGETFDIQTAHANIDGAAEGYLVVAANISITGTDDRLLILHTHDRGGTWFGFVLDTDQDTTTNPGGIESHQRDYQRLYVSHTNHTNRMAVRTISDHGHTSGLGYIKGIGGLRSDAMLCPYDLNLEIAYRMDSISGIRKTVTAWATGGQSDINPVVDPSNDSFRAHRRPHDIFAHWDPRLSFWIESEPSAPDFHTSADDFATETIYTNPLSANFNSNGWMRNLVRADVYQIGINQTVVPEIQAYFSADWETWVEHTGDINTLVGAGSTLNCMVSDWRSG